MKRRASPEQDFHAKAVAPYLRLALAPGVLWLHIPNGGARSAVEGGILKAMGARAGAFDLMFVWHAAGWGLAPCLAFLELKAPGSAGKLSKDQEDFALALNALGVPWAVARSIEEVDAALRQMGVPVRTSVRLGAPNLVQREGRGHVGAMGIGAARRGRAGGVVQG